MKEAQVIAEKTVIPLLEQGKEEQARAELDRALQKDPANKLVQSLLRQLNDDPIALLGRESFSYTVRANDSMSSIAAAYLKDRYLFYALARYNNIAVPRLLAAGQSIRVPGKAGTVQARPRAVETAPPSASAPASEPVAPPPAVVAVPTPAPAPAPAPAAPVVAPPTPGEQAMRAGAAAEKSKDFTRALAAYESAADLNEPGASAKVAATKTRLVAEYSRTARVARANQNLDAALTAWDRALALDPANEAARNERAEVVALKTKLERQRTEKAG